MRIAGLKLKMPKLKSWQTALLLCIVVPVGVLAAFKLTGMQGGTTAIAETETLQPAKWEFERPNRTTGVTENNTNENVTASYSCSDFSMNSTVTLYSYTDESEFGGSPCLRVTFSATASVLKGYVVDASVTFQENYTASQVYFIYNEWSFHFVNLSATDCVDGLTGVQKAYFNLTGLNSPSQVSFWRLTYWVLRSLYNQSHLLEVDIQFTYFNGTAYKRVVQPFLLKIFPDSNNSFETADEILINQTRRAYVDYSYNTVDYYKIWLQNSTTANFQLNYLARAGIEMRVYNPNEQLEVCLILGVNETLCQLTVNVNDTGWWYTKINAGSGYFIYTITVTAQSDDQ
jgi:hypothetical protein